MSIIQNIRDKGAWIIIGLIALALIAFIVQDAFQGGSSQLFGGPTTTLGKVNGKKIDRVEFEEKFKQMEEQMRANNYPMDETSLLSQRNNLWESYVQKIILTEEFENLGIEVTDKELGDILYGANPPQDLRQQFTDQNTGQYDAQAAYQKIQELRRQKNSAMYKNFFGEYIPALILQRQREKLQSMLSNSSYVPKWIVEKSNLENSQISSISFVNIPYTTIPDSTITVTDGDINAWVAKRKDAFQQEKARGIEYVAFDAAPSPSDSNLVVQQLLNIKDSFNRVNANEIKEFLSREFSLTPYYDGYISRKQIQIPNIDTIVKHPVGTVYGPYLDPGMSGTGNYVMSRVIGVKQIPDTVKVRHILVATHQQDQQSGQLYQVREDSTAKRIIDSVELAIRGGANFDTLCAKYSDDGTKNTGGVYDNVVSGQMTGSFNDFIFDRPVGSKGIVKTEYGFHYIENLTQRGSSPAYKIAYYSKPIYASDSTIQAANAQATQFAGDSRNKKAFDENVKKYKVNKFNGVDIKPLDGNISGINGNARELIRWMFNDASVGDVSDHPFHIGDKFVVPVVTQSYEKGTMDAERARPQIELRVRNEKKAEVIKKKIGNANSLDAISKAMNQPIGRADSISFSAPIIPNVGREPKVLGAAFNNNYKQKQSPAIPGDIGVFVIKVENIGAISNPAMDVKQQQAMMIQQEKFMSMQGGRWEQALKKSATIKDNRHKFF